MHKTDESKSSSFLKTTDRRAIERLLQAAWKQPVWDAALTVFSHGDDQIEMSTSYGIKH